MSKQILASTKTNQGEKTTMKIRNLILVLSALALPLQAADVGTANLNLPVAIARGETKLVGVFLARPVLLKGEVAADVLAGATSFTAFGSNTFGAYSPVSEVGAAELAPASDNHYILEFTSGPSTGLIKQVTAFSGSTATVIGSLPALTAGTSFVLRLDHTLDSLFPGGAGLKTGTSVAGADVISVLSSTGALNRFFYQTGFGWRLETNRGASGLNRAHVRVSLGSGFAFKANLAKTINLSGEYRGARSQITLEGTTGTIVANPYPVAVTLADSGLAQYLTKAANAAGSDSLRFLEGGRYVSYHNNGSNFVKSTGGAVSDSKVLGVGEAFLIVNKVRQNIAFAPQVIAE
jgi:hypothetical protein